VAVTGAPATPWYAGGGLDRASRLRRSPQRLHAALTTARTRVVPLWRDRCLVAADTVVWLGNVDSAWLPATADAPVFLGVADGRPLFAIDLSGVPEAEVLRAVGAERTVDVRHLVHRLEPAEAAILAYARSLCHWHRHQRYCGACGLRTRPVDGGAARECAGCRQRWFPRLDPVVVVLVEEGEPPSRCLLARRAGADDDTFAPLTGFVQVGESLEDAVRREVAEEAGIAVGSVRYVASQPWPFSGGLMVGFVARARADVPRVGGGHPVETRWFSRAELRARAARGLLGGPDSFDRLILGVWLEGEAG